MAGAPVTLTRDVWTATATIASSGTTSDAIDLGAASFGGVLLPSSLTGTAMTFTVCDTSGGTYVALTDADGAAISQTVAASKAFALPAEAFAFPFLKLVSGSSEGAARSIVVSLKG